VPGWGGADATATLAGRLAATQQLSRLMRIDASVTQSLWSPARYALLLAGLSLLGVGAGAAAAWLNRPAPLLATAENVSKIPKMGSAEEQYFYAQTEKQYQEEAWLAVARSFPPDESPTNKRYARLAVRGLASLYLSNNQLLKARTLYEELTSIDLKSEPNQKRNYISGLAGCAIVAYRLEDDVALRVSLAKLYPFSDEELADIGPQLSEALAEVLEANPRPAAE
jgi:hypothetical protein